MNQHSKIPKMQPQKQSKDWRKNPCELCYYFDNSKHKDDDRTKHAGICNMFSEITFINDTCKQWFSIGNLPADDIFNPKPVVEQTKLLL